MVELDGSGDPAQVHTFGAAGLVSRRMGGSTVFYTFDPQGGVAQRTDGGGVVVSSGLYDGSGAALAGGGDAFGFAGQWGGYSDAQTGLVLLTHRFYDPATGRFLTRDPAGASAFVTPDHEGYTGSPYSSLRVRRTPGVFASQARVSNPRLFHIALGESSPMTTQSTRQMLHRQP